MKFRDYAHALDWIETKAVEYGGKNKFYASAEYKKHYPLIKTLHAGEGTKYKTAAKNAMNKANAISGDKVRYDIVSPWGAVVEAKGVIIMRKGLPYVKLDAASAKRLDRKSVKWHKGFKKI